MLSLLSKRLLPLFFSVFLTSAFSLLADVIQYKPRVISKIEHPLPAFTQGLAIKGDFLYESLGLYGRSSFRILQLPSGAVTYSAKLPAHLFAEGLAILGDALYLITWKEEKALVFDLKSAALKKSLPYSGEGWGLCRDEAHFWMSDGSSRLTLRSNQDFTPLAYLNVSLEGKPLPYLNDLECVDAYIYANVWQQEWIAKINKKNGKVEGLIDASGLLTSSEKAALSKDAVLNGIAFRESSQTFFITGKEWPWIYEVVFEPSLFKTQPPP